MTSNSPISSPQADPPVTSTNPPAGETAQPPEPRNITARLKALESIQPGWYEGQGVAFNPADLAWLARQFEQRYPADLPRPLIAPTVEGNVELEWDNNHHVVFLEINPATRQGDWLSYQLPDKNEVEKTLDLNNPEDWQWLTQEIQNKLS